MEDLKKLMTESQNEISMYIDEMSTECIVKTINQEDSKVAFVIKENLDSIIKAVDLIYKQILSGGRLIYIGAGTSGRLGVLDASECPPTFGVDPNLVVGVIAGGDKALRLAIENVEDSLTQAQNDLEDLSLSSKDVVCGIAASGRTPYVIGGLEYAKQIRAKTISISCVKDAKISAYADCPVEAEVGPEVITGSTRMKAGTAQKMILNILTTATMIKLGKVYGNLMVDLELTNKKLQARALNIIMQTTGVSKEKAQVLLNQSQNDIKVAIMMGKMDVSADESKRLLDQSQGSITRALRSQSSLDLSSKYTICIDGGGTKTAFGLFDQEGKSIDEYVSISCHPMQVGVNGCAQIIYDGVHLLMHRHQLDRCDVSIGIAGYGHDMVTDQKIYHAIKDKLKDIPFVITSDIEIALIGALDNQDGICVVAGTGTIAMARYSSELIRCGGWGYELGDEGSAYWIGKQLLSHFTKQSDGREVKDELFDKIMDFYHLEDPYDLIDHIHDSQDRRQMISKLSQLCDENNNNTYCHDLLVKAAYETAQLVKTLKRQYPKLNTCAYYGSLFKSVLYKETFIKECTEINVIEPINNALYGAFLYKNTHVKTF